MKILFLGDVVGISGRSMVLRNLLSKIKESKIDFVVVNGENAADSGAGLTEQICKDFFASLYTYQLVTVSHTIANDTILAP